MPVQQFVKALIEDPNYSKKLFHDMQTCLTVLQFGSLAVSTIHLGKAWVNILLYLLLVFILSQSDCMNLWS